MDGELFVWTAVSLWFICYCVSELVVAYRRKKETQRRLAAFRRADRMREEREAQRAREAEERRKREEEAAEAAIHRFFESF
ncbi:MAG: hypothetical protein ACOC7N_03960 [Chloroflexota bacterium]